MAERILQSCYTNASYDIGGKVSSGWQSVSVSEDLPESAYNTCVGFQNKNSAIQKEMLDEHGNTLNLLEIIGDGIYVYIIRTQYGLKDRLGRANMFSHAFIFSWKDKEVLDNPNIISNIDKSNFKDNEDEANVIPKSLSRYSDFDIDMAIDISGLGYNEYLKLIRCVYTQMTEKNISDPLFIQYDGTEYQMRAIIYCIYYGLPHYLRKRLCIASNTSINDSDMNVVFSMNAKDKAHYFITLSGENNILTARTEKKIERYGFIDYVVKNLNDIDSCEYFDTLDNLALELGDLTYSNELVLKIAHKYMLANGEANDYTEDELEELLSDILRLKSSGSEFLEKFVTDILKEVIRRKILLTDEMQENLDCKLSVAVTPEFKKTVEDYNIYYLSTLDIETAAKKLGKMDRNVFETYVRSLKKTEDGLNIINYYYINIVLNGYDISWSKLNKILDDISVIDSKSKIEDGVGDTAWALYCKELKARGSVEDTYICYIDLMRRLVPNDKIGECSKVAKREYWDLFKYSDFSIEMEQEYLCMDISAESEICKSVLDLVSLINEVSIEAEDILLYHNYFKSNEISNNEVIFNCVRRELNKKYRRVSMQYISWIEVSSIVQSEKCAKILIKLYKSLNLNKYSDLKEYIIETTQFSKDIEPNLESILEKVSDIVIDFVKDNDSDENIVPLDIWLLVGCIRYDNPFYIFNRYKPNILSEDKLDVVKGSTLIAGKEYISAGEKYIKDKEAESKVVKMWISEVKKIEKKNIKDEECIKHSKYEEIDSNESAKDDEDTFKGLLSSIVEKARGLMRIKHAEEYKEEDDYDDESVEKIRKYKSRGRKR